MLKEDMCATVKQCLVTKSMFTHIIIINSGKNKPKLIWMTTCRSGYSLMVVIIHMKNYKNGNVKKQLMNNTRCH